MKRNMDLVRSILLLIEASETELWEAVPMNPLVEQGYSWDAIFYHVKLLSEAGLVEAKDNSTMNGTHWDVKSLTWQGHDFLDAAKNESIWHKGKEIVLTNTGGLTFETLKGVLIQLGKSAALSALGGDLGASQ